MRTALLATLLMVWPAAVSAQTYRFADIPETMTAEQARQTIEAQGFAFDERDEDGDYWFSGALMGWDAQILAFITPEGTVAKLIVRLLTPDADAIPTYETVRAALVEKYGEPQTTVRQFESPFKDGDGSEQEAIRVGKATIATLWMEGEENGSLAVNVSEQLTVDLSYDYPSWADELARRRKAAASTIF